MDSDISNAIRHLPPHSREEARRHFISSCADTLEALRRINALGGESMTLFVAAADGKLLGTVTDGDIRRALIAGAKVTDPVTEAMHRDFLHASPSDISIRARQARDAGIDLLPVTDSASRLLRLIDLRRTHAVLPLDAVLMAGGKGERLRPLTLDCPKPLLKLGGTPIIDINIKRLADVGISNVYVTVNYLKEMLAEHFALPCHGIDVRCVEEPKRLGTFGSLSLVEGLKEENLLVMNSDILTTLDFEKMYIHHIESGAALTMAVTPYTVSVPFAILRTEEDRVTGLEEKPVYNHFANAGVYIMRRELLGRLPHGEYADAPDFIAALIADGLKVGYFPIDGIWVDIGSPADFRHASELMSMA